MIRMKPASPRIVPANNSQPPPSPGSLYGGICTSPVLTELVVPRPVTVISPSYEWTVPVKGDASLPPQWARSPCAASPGGDDFPASPPHPLLQSVVDSGDSSWVGDGR